MEDPLDRNEEYVKLNKLWESLLFCILNTLFKKGLKPLPERTLAILQLIACNDITIIEYWLDIFAQFYDKDTYTKIINRLIIAIPDFIQNVKGFGFGSDFYLNGFSLKQRLHNTGCNLLTAIIFFSKSNDKYPFSVRDIERLIQKYSLDINAPNQVSKVTSHGHEEKGQAPSDMTTTYKTTFGRVVNVLFHYTDADITNRFKAITKLLLPTADVSELEKILYWYTNLNKDVPPESIKRIQKIDVELNLAMRSCSHSLFKNKDILPILQSYHSMDEDVKPDETRKGPAPA